jgi:hypothetical protein
VSLIPLSRANNISIMLTQFSNFRRGPDDIRRAVCAGELGPERLSLLLQVRRLSAQSHRWVWTQILLWTRPGCDGILHRVPWLPGCRISSKATQGPRPLSCI